MRTPPPGGRRSTPAAWSCCPASSTCTCTSTSLAEPGGKAPRPAAARWPPAAARCSSTCRSTRRPAARTRAALEAASITDFGLWGGLVPGSVREMADMAGRGVVGFKAFMCDSGLPEFPRADDTTLLDGLREAARLGLPVSVHAESDEITRRLTQRTTER